MLESLELMLLKTSLGSKPGMNCRVPNWAWLQLVPGLLHLFGSEPHKAMQSMNDEKRTDATAMTKRSFRWSRRRLSKRALLM